MNNTTLKIKPLLPGKFPIRLLGISLATIASGSVFFAIYLFISRTVVYNSDNASILLQAQAMQQGNVLLQGWYLPTDNWLTLEIPLYTLGLLLGFSMTSLLHIIPALLYTLVVLAGGFLASTLLQGKQRIWSWLAFLGIVAFPPLNMVQGFLVGPIHISTILFTLLGLLAYKHSSGRKGGKKVAFAGVLLLIVQMVIGDPLVLVLFVLPLILTEGSQALANKRLVWREHFRMFGIVLAIVLAFSLRRLTDLAGVHNLLTAGFLLKDLPGIGSNLISAIVSLFVLFHANIFVQNPLADVSIIPNVLMLISLVYSAFRWSIRSLLRPTTEEARVISVLIWGSIGILSAFTLSTLGGETGRRYLYALVFFGGVLSHVLLRPFYQRYLLYTLLALTFLANSTAFAVSCYQAPNAVIPESQLIAFLQEKHLTSGLGSYWVSPIVTVQSKGRVILRQIEVKNHRLHPFYFLADQEWFDRSNLQDAKFIVFRDRDGSWMYYQASLQSFGRPDHYYKIGMYTVLTWNAPLLTHMQPGYSF